MPDLELHPAMAPSSVRVGFKTASVAIWTTTTQQPSGSPLVVSPSDPVFSFQERQIPIFLLYVFSLADMRSPFVNVSGPSAPTGFRQNQVSLSLARSSFSVASIPSVRNVPVCFLFSQKIQKMCISYINHILSLVTPNKISYI